MVKLEVTCASSSGCFFTIYAVLVFSKTIILLALLGNEMILVSLVGYLHLPSRIQRALVK